MRPASGERPIHREHTRNAHAETAHSWQLLHEDPFDRITTDAELERVVTSFTSRGTTPYTEMLRRLVGIEQMSEPQARVFFGRILDHQRGLAKTLGRAVHVRVAALDLLATRPPIPGGRRHDSRPIVVTPLLLERAFEEATADAVTGLPQRAQFMHVLGHELKQRKRRTVCIAYIDLDGFKRVNDEHGHARGDDVLRALARSARGVLREGDMLARLGGDEFALLLLDVMASEADVALLRLRRRFETVTGSLRTSFSAGVAIAMPGEDADGVLKRADDAMFREKRRRAGTTSG